MKDFIQKTASVKFTKDCTIYEISDMYKKISDAFKKAPKVKLDCSKIEIIDSSFIQLLIATELESKRNNIELEIYGDFNLINDFSESIYCHLDLKSVNK